ncbi:hypothetical protein ACOQFV_08330 [Nocardiopsis changdeensis]|uniref:XdhC family protein n=1 Tax=Nocardiopsis changdeensis TaxID=2831969 RepID=A0ABX8BJ54_9ACTN|nr:MULTISPECIES: hypothetical protein [Nocardiopsis]QUX20438.1 hypothetical protein KGD84_18150 [Nocardiopsis changdeensis]QYX36368.1 hypothetical protein K1J57_27605 [Nocardiopsis sp. MT53]
MTGRAEWDRLAERLRAARSGRDAVVAAVDGLSPVGGIHVLSRAPTPERPAAVMRGSAGPAV